MSDAKFDCFVCDLHVEANDIKLVIEVMQDHKDCSFDEPSDNGTPPGKSDR